MSVFGVTDAKNEEKKTEVSCKMEINREKWWPYWNYQRTSELQKPWLLLEGASQSEMNFGREKRNS